MRAVQYTTSFEDDYFPKSEDGKYVSESEYWEKYYEHPDFKYEWNNGILEEKPMADYLSSQMYIWFNMLLHEYLKANPIAKVITLDIGFRLALSDKVTIRKPDLAVIVRNNPVDIEDDDHTFRGIYDLCIEFLSDSTPKEAERDTIIKKYEYGRIGVREYFILDRKGNDTAFYTLKQKLFYSPIRPLDGEIVCSTVLPGFQFRIDDLYTRPPLIERVDDEVYKHFILKDYQAERTRADVEHLRAEKLAAKLRSLGINPDDIE